MDPLSPERPRLRRGLSAVRISDDKGSVHTYNEEEKQGLVDIVNDLLKDDPQLNDTIPIDPASQDIFDSVHDGVLLCKLVNTIRPRTIDPNKINNKSDLKLFEKLENLTEAVNGTQIALNMPLVNIGVNDLLEGKPVLVLAVLWQLINLHLHTQVARTAHIVRLDYLLKDEVDKSIDDEQLRILLRWFNHHLSNANHPRRVSNLAGDIRDSENYIVLLNQLAPRECTRQPLAEPDLLKRAELFLEQAARIGCKKFLGPVDIVQGNSRLNFAFLANLFTKFQRPPSPPPVAPVVVEKQPPQSVPIPPAEIDKYKIVEEKKRIQDEAKAREIQQLQKAIVIAKELLNLPSAEVLQEAIAVSETEIKSIQKLNASLRLEVEDLTEKAIESHQATIKAEEDTYKAELEVKHMVEKHEKEVSHLQTKLEVGVAKVATLKRQIDEAVKVSEKLTKTKAVLQEQKVELDEKIDVQTRDSNRLTRIREKLDAELVTTQKSLAKVQTNKTKVEIAITKVEKQIQEINNEIVDINKTILKVEHYTEIAKEDLEQERERVAIVQKEKMRLVARKSELEEEMYELQEKLQQEEEFTQNAVKEEKERAREEYTKFLLAADRELLDAQYNKEVELQANVDILARKEAASIERMIVQTKNLDQKSELREVSRQLRDANSEMLLIEKRNTKLEETINRAHKRNDERVEYNQQEAAKLEELKKKEKEMREALLDKQTAADATEFRKSVLNREMEEMRAKTAAAELEAASAERDARSIQLEMEIMATLPEELNRQKNRHQAMKAYDEQLLDMKDSARHEREMNRKKREKEVKERDRDLALTLLRIEEERVNTLQKEKEELEATHEKLVPLPKRKVAAAEDDDIDDLLAKANAILLG